MMAWLMSWWRQRTGRERLLLQVAAALIVALLPVALFAGASRYREAAAAELHAATKLGADIQWMRDHAPLVTAQEAEGGLRGAAIASAQQAGLTIARLEPAGPDRLRVAFAPANSVSIYRWLDAVGRRGVFVARTAITRRGDGDDVEAEFDLAAAPS